ncbi:MAG TPA: Gfo/Idh/MocA family oxidoreductase [Opitutaceae bacterium]|nr:Gfo/Idh/MocA family oxidoreductase [Opitutaceae bacterium]
MKFLSHFLAVVLLVGGGISSSTAAEIRLTAPLRVLVAGLEHGHASGFIRSLNTDVITLVGVWEPNEAVWSKYGSRPQLASVPRFTDLSEALVAVSPEAVWAFSDTRTHLDVVRAAAPRKIDVIVEKPLAISWRDAAEMRTLAARHETLVLTNYETSWYPSFTEAKAALAADGAVGRPRHLYIQAGHTGPAKRGTSPEFLVWLRDPARSGGGALFDFGCYGANLATWWLENREPDTVTAFLSRFDPQSYPDCDDHATVQLVYADVQVTCVGSWSWPYSRKDAALYGERGALVTVNDRHYSIRNEKQTTAESRVASTPRRDSQRWYAETIRAGRDPVTDPSSLANNLIVTKILEAARRSALEGKTIRLSEIDVATGAPGK